MSDLFDSLTQRSITFRNRIGVSPMCQYSAVDGMPTPWHLVHLGSRAVGGAGTVIVEATAVEPIGRISPADAGIWSDAHADAWQPIAAFLREHGAVPGIQLAHAGRKASTSPPWEKRRAALTPAEGGWQPVAPSAIAFNEHSPVPTELSPGEIAALTDKFVTAAKRAVSAGFELIELHAAHGYLFHSFLSPLSNHRTDAYGGSFENRTRFLRETATKVRAAIGDKLPLWTRLSTTDWAEGGWAVDDSIQLSRELKSLGVDLIDCSSGGNVPRAKIPVGPGYQVPAAERIRREANIPTAAVGLISTAEQASDIVKSGQADMVLVARQSLRDAYWPIHVAKKLGVPEKCPPPKQYERAFD
jgi:2,4-dienoyl-CoA reductase-like NADH-dependent reductase (Old Yellow Enzyme family)